MPHSIAVAGKGGTGKSTIAALIIAHLVREKLGPVLAVDADADANLGTMLGVEPAQSIGSLREDLLEEFKNFPAGMTKAQYVQAGLHQIVEEAEGFDLIAMGRGEGSGCYCYVNSLIQKFSSELMPGYPWTVIDNEAGMEHISRRTTSNIDALVLVVNDNPIAVKTARNIHQLANSLKNNILHQFLVTNMVPEQRRDDVKGLLQDLPVEHLGDIPPVPGLPEVLFRGGSVRELAELPGKECWNKLITIIGGDNGDT